MTEPIRVLVWNENVHERESPIVAKIYPKGIHGCIADALAVDKQIEVRTATLRDPDHGLTNAALDKTDVLIWWGHAAHGKVKDENRGTSSSSVLAGDGFRCPALVALLQNLQATHGHQLLAHLARSRRVGTRLGLQSGTPIATGIDRYFEIENTEMYGEPFAIPAPDEIVFISWYEGGEVFRSGCAWKRGNGKIFYFAPGHEMYPIYFNQSVQRVLRNAVRWAAPDSERWIDSCPQIPISEAREPLKHKGPSLHKEGEEGFK